MKISLTKIGNSKGIIIPSHILKKFEITDEILLEEHDDKLVLKKPARKPREGWDEQIKKVLKEDPKAFELTDEDKDWINMPGPASFEEEWVWEE